MKRILRVAMLLLCGAVAFAACETEETEKDKPPLEVKQEEAKDSTRLDPARDTDR